MKKQEKGITLVALVITVIVLIIIASIGISSGKGTIKSAKFSKFQAELKIMQNKVNEWNKSYENGETVNIGTDPTSDQKLALESQDVSEIITNKAGSDTTKIGEIKSSFRMLTNDYITRDLGIDSVEGEYLVNIKERMVVSTEAFEYDGVNYYMIDQMEEELYNVEYKNQNDTGGEFTVNATQTGEEEWKIKITDIQHEKYVSKWQVKYKKEGTTYWKTTDKLEFTVPEGTYQIELVHGNEISLGTKKVKASNYADQPEGGGAAFSRAVGTTDIVFLVGTTYTAGTANAPDIDENTMIPINWNGTNWVITDKANWDYCYDMTNKKWANVMLTDGAYTIDKSTKEIKYTKNGTTETINDQTKIINEEDLGSMFVWIPRYSYKISYFENETDKQAYISNREDETNKGKIIGYSDARGIVDAEGKIPSNVTGGTVSIAVGDNYRPHPVFEKDISKGGWGKKTTGIWVGKFEATSKTSATNGTNMIVPNQTSQRNINVARMFTKAEEIGTKLNMTLDSHIMKNSEWGATVYLAESQYGRNGTKISVNQCSSFYTGVGRGLTSTEDSTKTGTSQLYNEEYEWKDIKNTQKYDGVVGMLSSSTGNIYGIYDLSGGAWERVMGFFKDENGICSGYDKINNSGYNGYLGNEKIQFTEGQDLPNEKYYQIYLNYDASTTGDAIYETTSENKSWNIEAFKFIETSYPVFVRGGFCDESATSGSFSFSNTYGGSASYGHSFRPVLAF